MDEKVLIQHSYVDDEKYPKTKKRLLALLIVGLIALVPFLALKNADYPMNEVSIFAAVVAAFCLLMWLFFFPLFILNSKMSITVTNNRAYGRAFKEEVNLPMDSITSISKTRSHQTFLPYALSFSSSSGSVKFTFATEAKRDEVYQIVNEQLVNRQNNKGSVVVMNQTSTPDDLKKYKELLESGVITQEEFDAKKKQLLGL